MSNSLPRSHPRSLPTKHPPLLSFAALASIALLTGCTPTLGPGEAWYTFHNQQNNFAQLRIDGRITGPTYRPDESREIPLLMSVPHTIVVAHGSNTMVFNGDDFVQRYAVEYIDPPYTVVWSHPAGWTVAPSR